MIDVNRLLTQVMGGQAMGGQGMGAQMPQTPGPGHDVQERGPAGWHAGGSDSGSAGLLRHAGTFGAGALAGGLAGTLLGSKRIREVAGTALQIGAVAAIGGLAYKAYQNHRQGKPIIPQRISDTIAESARQFGIGSGGAGTQAPAAGDWIPPPEKSDAVGQLMLRAMVAAASADGRLDQQEYNRIRQQLLVSGLNEEEQMFLAWVMKHPPTIDELAAAATTPELRAETYAAARLAIEPDSPAERDWLTSLATALQLPPGLKEHIDALEGVPVAARQRLPEPQAS